MCLLPRVHVCFCSVCVRILTVFSRIRPSSACCCTGCLKFLSKCACVCVCLFFVSLICWFYFASAKCITVQHRSSLQERRGSLFYKRLIRCTATIMAVPKAAGNGASLLRSCHMLLARAEGHRGGGALLNSLARNQSWRKVSVFWECLLHFVSQSSSYSSPGRFIATVRS